MADIVAFDVDGVVQALILLVALLLGVQELNGDARAAVAAGLAQMADADENRHQGEHGAHDVQAVAHVGDIAADIAQIEIKHDGNGDDAQSQKERELAVEHGKIKRRLAALVADAQAGNTR